MTERTTIIAEGLAIPDAVSMAAFCITVSEAYEAAPVRDPRAVKFWNLLNNHNSTVLLKRLKGTGLKVEYTPEDPYGKHTDDPSMMVRYMLYDMVVNRRLEIYSGHSDNHPVFTEKDNVIFRTVHDYVTHGKLRGVFNKNLGKLVQTVGRGNLPTPDQLASVLPQVSLSNEGNIGHSFTIRGELNATSTHIRMAPDACAAALFTEVAGQASYATLTDGFPAQKVAILSGFDYQKIGLCTPGSPQAQRMEELKGLLKGDPNKPIRLRVAAKPQATPKELLARFSR